ncbi:MAG: nuclear transport factor 2 family protein, partial [Luteitalea sp.]
VAAVNSALQLALATLPARDVTAQFGALTDEQTGLLDRYVEAFHEYDDDGLVTLLREDAALSMPPYTLWLRGHEPIRSWLLGRGIGCRGSRLVPVEACGSPAFAQYRRAAGGSHQAWALIVLELSGGQIASWTSFLDVEALFPTFGLPIRLAA